MKAKLLPLLSIFLIVISCKKNSSPPAPPASDVHLKNGLLLYLPFDGNMADSSGNGNITTAVAGAALTYDEHGKPNSAFAGTGNGERILVTNNGSITFDTAFTVSANVMSRAIGRYAIVEFLDNTNGQSYSLGVGTTSTSPFNLDYGVSNHLATCGSFPVTANLFMDTASFLPEPESWYNMVVIFHKGNMSAYINGNLVTTKTGGDATVKICPSAKVIVGGWWDGDPASINGKLDEIRIYNRVLNADEITELSKEFQ